MEIWKDIKGYKPIYQVSNEGRIKSICRETSCYNGGILKRKERLLKPTKTRRYSSVFLYDVYGKRKSVLLHRLVAMAFVSNPNNLSEIDHIDGNPENNRADNLRWVTHKENCNNPITMIRYKGKKPWKNKAVRCFTSDGKFIKQFENITIAAKETGAHRENISKCCKGKYKTTNNLIFKYV